MHDSPQVVLAIAGQSSSSWKYLLFIGKGHHINCQSSRVKTITSVLLNSLINQSQKQCYKQNHGTVQTSLLDPYTQQGSLRQDESSSTAGPLYSGAILNSGIIQALI
jgi:hypothetical protein